jgi:hypothetical protein
MPSYSITPTSSGAYDVVITDADGGIRRVLGLPSLTAALEWITNQRIGMDGAEPAGGEESG